MVVAGSPLSQVMVAPTTAKKERAKTAKPQSRCADLGRSFRKVANRTKAKAARQKQPGPGTRPGSHQQLPITIDSDEESDTNQTTNATTQSQSQNLWSGSDVHISQPEAFANHIRSQSTASFANEGIEITLADIKDFELRHKTAQLMAVAPRLPVADLYHLLVDLKGHLEGAKQEAIRRSQAPFSPSPPRQSDSGRAATVPIPNKAQDDVDDDDKIKIEFDHTFTWDNDAPAAPPPELGRRRHHNKPIPKTASKPAKPIGKSSRSLMSAPASSRCFTFPETVSAKPCPPATKSFKAQHAKPTKSFDAAGKPRKGHAIKVTKGKAKTSGDINRGMRATSYDREFIVPDEEVILENSDDTYSDSSDNSASDIDMTDDETDLAIDMEPEYAYNSDILSSPGS